MTFRVIEADKPATKYGLAMGRQYHDVAAAMIAAELWHNATGKVCIVWEQVQPLVRRERYRSTGALIL